MIDNRELDEMPKHVGYFFRKLQAIGENGLADIYMDLHLHMEVLDRQRKRVMYVHSEWVILDNRVAEIQKRLRELEALSRQF